MQSLQLLCHAQYELGARPQPGRVHYRRQQGRLLEHGGDEQLDPGMPEHGRVRHPRHRHDGDELSRCRFPAIDGYIYRLTSSNTLVRGDAHGGRDSSRARQQPDVDGRGP